MKYFLTLTFFIFTGWQMQAQNSGCTDPKAVNYNAAASVNDGSCLYKPVRIKPKQVVRKLDKRVPETSGLIYWEGSLWTHNDSGGENRIFRLNPESGKVEQSVTISNATNRDWEDISHDSLYIYIGDFGNNAGTRKDLTIYKILKERILPAADVVVEAEKITFSFADQSSFEPNWRSNDYDCESMLAVGDSLVLFSKNWGNQRSRIYVLPKEAGSYVLQPRSEFDTDGLVTGADISADGKLVALIGYKDYVPFIWLLNNFTGNDFFSGCKQRLDMTDHLAVQAEGISVYENYRLYISSEKTKIGNALLLELDASPWIPKPIR